MRISLNVPLLGINRTYKMFARYSCVQPFPLMTMCPSSEQVLDIEHDGASIGDDFDAKMN